MYPGASSSPDLASRTSIEHLLARRSANREVKSGGICCAITIGTGNPAGKGGKNRASASGPPVETPMATSSTREPAGAIHEERAWGEGGEEAAFDRAAAGLVARTGFAHFFWHSAFILGISC